MDEQMIELPRGHDFIDEEALDRWRDRSGKGGHDFSANNNTVWRLVATIDHFRAAHSVMASKVAELEGVVAAFADGADKCAEAPHFIVQPFLAIFTKHGAAIASARRAALAHPKGME